MKIGVFGATGKTENFILKEAVERGHDGTAQIITIKAKVNATVEKVWRYWTEPEHIKKWNSASEDWHTPLAENDLRSGGKFFSRMECVFVSIASKLITAILKINSSSLKLML